MTLFVELIEILTPQLPASDLRKILKKKRLRFPSCQRFEGRILAQFGVCPQVFVQCLGQTAQNEVFAGFWREAAGDFGGVLAEFLNFHMSELRKGGKYRITGQQQVDDFRVVDQFADHVWSLEEIIGLLDLANAKI